VFPDASNTGIGTLLVVLLDVGEVEADDVGGVAGGGGVGEEAGAFSGADGAESFGNDVG
jgi:hypothetical protein